MGLFKHAVGCCEVPRMPRYDFLDLSERRCAATYPQSGREWAQLIAHHDNSTWPPLAVSYSIYYSQHSVGLIHCLQSIRLCCLSTRPVILGLLCWKIQGLENYSPPRDERIYLMYFLTKLWLSCDIQCLTPLTFSSNSLRLAEEPEHRAEHHLNRSVLSWAQI